jgi:heptosyltransferase-2
LLIGEHRTPNPEPRTPNPNPVLRSHIVPQIDHLVILAPNWLGDAVMALPAIADVRRAAAGARIAVAARPSVAPLFALVPEIDETIVLKRRASIGDVSSWRGIGAELAGRQFEAALLLPNSIHSTLIAARAGIPERWGYRAPLRTGLLTRAIARRPAVHQVDYYQQLVAGLGFANGAREPRIRVAESMRAAGERLLGDAGWDGIKTLIALAPGAAYGGAKRWPPESFAELAASLAADGVSCVLVGSAADRVTCGEVARAVSAVVGADSERAADPPKRLWRDAGHATFIDLVGRTDLATLAGVLTCCRALVTNDSGAMHLAAAAGVAVTAVFGPTNEHATRPVGDAHVVVTRPVWCRPCMLRECPINHRCMRGVRVGTVLDAARRTL